MLSTNNGQSAALNLSNEQLQVLLTGKFGDGCIPTPKTSTSNTYYMSNCIYKEYLDFKKDLLGDLFVAEDSGINQGFSNKLIYTIRTHSDPRITAIKNMTIEEALNHMNDLGLALWFYDDGSLHKNKLFYNLNTQAFSEEVNREIFVPFLQKFNIYAKPTIERKKDGREFWYLRIGRYEGSYEITQILNKYPVQCFNYKVWSSETIQNWSKLQEWLKSTGNEDASTRKQSVILKKIERGEL